MKVEVQYQYSLVGRSTAQSFVDDAYNKATEFFGPGVGISPDIDITVVVSTSGLGLNLQYHGSCVAVKKVEVQ